MKLELCEKLGDVIRDARTAADWHGWPGSGSGFPEGGLGLHTWRVLTQRIGYTPVS